MIGRVWAERFPMGQVYMESHAVPICPPSLGPPRIVSQAARQSHACIARFIACWRHVDNLPVHQFRLALHLVQVLNCGACFRGSRLFSSSDDVTPARPLRVTRGDCQARSCSTV